MRELFESQMPASRLERDLSDWEDFRLGEWGFGASRFQNINKRFCELKNDIDALGLEGSRDD